MPGQLPIVLDPVLQVLGKVPIALDYGAHPWPASLPGQSKLSLSAVQHVPAPFSCPREESTAYLHSLLVEAGAQAEEDSVPGGVKPRPAYQGPGAQLLLPAAARRRALGPCARVCPPG